jgi:tungstate transport system permease protein
MQDVIIQAFQKALQLILSGDSEVFNTVFRSLYVSALGTLLSCLWGIPIATAIGLHSFRGKWLIRGIFNALIGVPTVALGLLLYLLMSKQGEFGFLHLLYTLNGIAVGQSILVTPLIVSFTSNALGAADAQLRDLAKTLGASSLRVNSVIIRETIWSTVLAVIAAFNRGFGELGVAMMIGGNFFQETRVLTTSIATETTQGQFAIAMAYAIILMAIVLAIALTVNLVERLRQEERIRIRERILKRFGRKQP